MSVQHDFYVYVEPKATFVDFNEVIIRLYEI